MKHVVWTYAWLVAWWSLVWLVHTSLKDLEVQKRLYKQETHLLVWSINISCCLGFKLENLF